MNKYAEIKTTLHHGTVKTWSNV